MKIPDGSNLHHVKNVHSLKTCGEWHKRVCFNRFEADCMMHGLRPALASAAVLSVLAWHMWSLRKLMQRQKEAYQQVADLVTVVITATPFDMPPQVMHGPVSARNSLFFLSGQVTDGVARKLLTLLNTEDTSQAQLGKGLRQDYVAVVLFFVRYTSIWSIPCVAFQVMAELSRRLHAQSQEPVALIQQLVAEHKFCARAQQATRRDLISQLRTQTGQLLLVINSEVGAKKKKKKKNYPSFVVLLLFYYY